jgi:hypothetical protein
MPASAGGALAVMNLRSIEHCETDSFVIGDPGDAEFSTRHLSHLITDPANFRLTDGFLILQVEKLVFL